MHKCGSNWKGIIGSDIHDGRKMCQNKELLSCQKITFLCGPVQLCAKICEDQIQCCFSCGAARMLQQAQVSVGDKLHDCCVGIAPMSSTREQTQPLYTQH